MRITEIEELKEVVKNPLTDYDNLADALLVEILYLQSALEMIQLGLLTSTATPQDIYNLIIETLDRPNPKLRRVIDDCRRSTQKVADEFRNSARKNPQ